MGKTPRTYKGARTPQSLKEVRASARRNAVQQPKRTAAKSLVAKALEIKETETSKKERRIRCSKREQRREVRGGEVDGHADDGESVSMRAQRADVEKALCSARSRLLSERGEETSEKKQYE